MRRARILLVALSLAGIAAGVQAHEVRPGYLSVRQIEAESFDVLWKVPAKGNLRLSLHARLPDHCSEMAPRSNYFGGGASSQRWTVTCPGGLTGGTITIDGLSGTLTDVLVRLERTDGTTQVARLSPAEVSFVVQAAPSATQVAGTYLGLGFEHILLGIDHLLFVLALLILVEGRRRLVGTVTAFTVAHSLTLGAATLGFVNVPQTPVEAIIALSIVFVASEIVRARQGKPGLTQRRPWIVAFTFGLLHGFGFAGALTEIGLPAQAVPLALLFFNVGVESGQLAFIAAVGVLIVAARRLTLPQPTWAWRVPAYGIGAVAAFWTIERVVGFWA
ncbi:MAG: HupE/UreJ family protein [bacterium]|nr:HupE/UreJ family protein [bacterium]